MIYLKNTFDKLCSNHVGWLEHNIKSKNDKRMVLENSIVFCSNLNVPALDKSMFNNITFIRCKFNNTRFDESLFVNSRFINCALDKVNLNMTFFSNCVIVKSIINGRFFNREEINGVGCDIMKSLTRPLNIDMILEEEMNKHEKIKVESNSLSHISLNV